MGLFDQLKQKAVSELKTGVAQAVSHAQNKSETFTFPTLPTDADALRALPEAALDTPFRAAALAMAALCSFERDEAATIAMLNVLKGPEPVSEYEKQFLRERLRGKQYKVSSFFAGASVDNGYQPSTPYTITVSDNPYSYPEPNWATLYVTSAGADSPRPIKLRKKPSTGQWFLNELQCLADIRVPKEQDPWA